MSQKIIKPEGVVEQLWTEGKIQRVAVIFMPAHHADGK